MTFLSSLAAATRSIGAPSIKAAVVAGSRDVVSSGRFTFQYMNGQAVLYDYQTASLVRSSYMLNADFYAVIRYLIRKSKRANYYLYEEKDKKAFNEYRQLKGEGATYESLKYAQLIRKKALTEASNIGIDKLLSKPSNEQNFRSFSEEAIAYKLLTGERFIHRIPGLEPVSKMYILPSTLMEVKSGETFKQVGGYKYVPTQVDLLPEEVIFSRDFNPALTGNAEDLRGLSPLRALALSIQKSNEGKTSSIRQYQYGGPPGILSVIARDEEPSLTPEQVTMVKNAIIRDSGSSNRGRVHVMSQKAEWTQLGLSPVDLDILESGQYDLRDFCRAYGIDSKVVGDPTSSTYNNMAEARKAAIVDAVIPICLDFADDLNAVIEPFNVNGKRYFIDTDVTGFPELAEDMNAMVDRLMKAPLKINEIREAMQYEPDPNPLCNEIWMDNSKTPLSQFGVQADDTGVVNDGSY